MQKDLNMDLNLNSNLTSRTNFLKLPLQNPARISTQSGLRRSAVLCGVLVLVAGCGAPVKSSSCSVKLAEDTRAIEGTALKLTLRGTFSGDCAKVYSDNNGDSTMKLSSEVKTATPTVYLGELVAGERKFTFTKEDANFKGATFSTSFKSTLVAQWRFPWADKPGTISLTVFAPADALPEQLPTGADLELSL